MCIFSTSERPKVVQTPQFFTLLTWKCASRHNGVHFFDIATSKSGLRPRVFDTFDLEMCFAPQRRALFRQLNFSKLLRTWGVLYVLTWKCASRHNGVQFFISHLTRWLRTRRFNEVALRPSGATNHSKNTAFRAPASSFFSLFLFSDLLTSFLLLSDSSHLCFSISPYCQKFDF